MVITVRKLKWSDLYGVKNGEVFTMKQATVNSKDINTVKQAP